MFRHLTRLPSARPSSLQQLRFQSTSPAKKLRPVSPHVQIYQPQLTWVMSIAHRVTGAGLAGGTTFQSANIIGISSLFNFAVGIYGASIWYALAPFSSSAVVSAVAALPGVALFAGKFLVAAPYSYHFFNGVRHLLWDAKFALTLKGVYASGYATQAATVASTLYLLSL